MTQEQANKIFETQIGIQLEMIYVTSDDVAHIRYKEALAHIDYMIDVDPEGFTDLSIDEWYKEELES